MAALDAAFNTNSPWPAIPDDVSDSGKKASMSGTTTRKAEPPKYHKSRNVNDYLTRGQNAVNAVRAQLAQNTMPAAEDTFVHRSEADVVRSAALYLLHPVNMALSYRSPATYKCCSEFRANTVRSDMTFYRETGTAAEPLVAFAVVEFKNRGVIWRDPSAWERTVNQQGGARLTDQVLALPAYQNNVVNVVAGAPGNDAGEWTYFTENPLVLVKQAASYALSYRVRYVALFDWDTLVLIYFNQLDIGGKYCGDRITTTVLRAPNDRGQFRVALLGFLEEALANP